MYLKLTDVRWALGVEVCLKSLIHSFCCHDHHDAKILQRMMAGIYPQNARQPSVITSKFEVSGSETCSDFSFWMGGGSYSPYQIYKSIDGIKGFYSLR